MKRLLDTVSGFVKERLAASAIKGLRYRKRAVLRAMHARVLGTPPVACHARAAVEVHTVTAHHHLTMYLTAIKSLLRYYTNIAVVVHDDGSLDDLDKESLRRHVEGIRIIDRKDADARMREILAEFPRARDLRERVINSFELFDNILLARTDRIVNMNSDVLFLQDPRELVVWLDQEDASLAGVYEETPAKQRDFLKMYGCPLEPHVTTALTCIHRDIYDLPFVEEVLSRTTPDWFTAQNVYPLLFHRQGASRRRPIRFFDRDKYQSSGVFPDGAAFRHYWTSTGWFTKLQSRDSQHVIAALGAAGA